MKAIGVHDFAGAFALGMAKAGFELVGKREGENAAGIEAWERNKRLLKYSGDLEALPAAQWTPMKVDAVFGNPPCSAFSLMSKVDHRLTHIHGSDSFINQCMHDLVQYAGSCSPTTVIFESVQGAYKSGRDLMVELREELEHEAGRKYTLTHVLHSGIGNGNAQVRPRYFWVASRKPFGVEPHPLRLVTTVRDRIGDLEDVPLGSIDGHVCVDSPMNRRHTAMLLDGVRWDEGEKSAYAIKRAKKNYGFTQYEKDSTNAYRPRRLRYDEPSFVVIGDAPVKFVHPVLPRFITFREAMRIMGFPDSFKSWNMRAQSAYRLIGKQIPVENGAWIAKWAASSMQGKPGSVRGDKIGDREYLIDLTNLWKEQTAGR